MGYSQGYLQGCVGVDRVFTGLFTGLFVRGICRAVSEWIGVFPGVFPGVVGLFPGLFPGSVGVNFGPCRSLRSSRRSRLSPQAAPRAPRRHLAAAAPQRRPRTRWRPEGPAGPGPEPRAKPAPSKRNSGREGTKRAERRGYFHRATCAWPSSGQGCSHQPQPCLAAELRELPPGATGTYKAHQQCSFTCYNCPTKTNIRTKLEPILEESAIPN